MKLMKNLLAVAYLMIALSIFHGCGADSNNGANQARQKADTANKAKASTSTDKEDTSEDSIAATETRQSHDQQNRDEDGLLQKVLSDINQTEAKDEVMNWQALGDGLAITVYQPQKESVAGRSQIVMLQINPEKAQMALNSIKQYDTSKMKANQWAQYQNLIALTNAGMFQSDYETSVGYMKDHDHVNNPTLNKYNAVAAFNRKDSTVPRFQIIDLNCQNWESLKGQYHSLFQSIRMISCHGNNVWSPQDKKWSEACLAEDKEGHAYFIFCRSPYTMHDFIDILVNSPIDFTNAMHLEGGPEASFYLDYRDIRIQLMGSWETGFYEDNKNDQFWGLPNVIGVKKR